MQIRFLTITAIAIASLGSALVFSQPPRENNDLVVRLNSQVEALQQEVQTLRGTVEEQGYQLKRLQTEQKDRYLDIDRRLSALAPVSPLPAAPLSPAESLPR